MPPHEMIDITPPTNLLRSMRAETFKHESLVGEAIDNSFDAGAKTVNINIQKDSIQFDDDGLGILPDRIVALFSPGHHSATSTTQLGRFGIRT